MEDDVILVQVMNCLLHFVVSLWLNHVIYNVAQENQGMHFVDNVYLCTLRRISLTK